MYNLYKLIEKKKVYNILKYFFLFFFLMTINDRDYYNGTASNKNRGFTLLRYVNDNNGVYNNNNDDKTLSIITNRYKLLKSNHQQRESKENVYKYRIAIVYFLSKIFEFKRFNLTQK